ncbi:MAG: dihydrolipoamide acetyltransferase family protein, partial [Solirubrobacterales bacterium]
PTGGGAHSPTAVGGDGRVKASPLAKRIARDRGLDLHGLTGSGPSGRIVKADVEKALAAGVAAPATAPAPAAPPAPAGPTPGVSERPETAKGRAELVELTKLQQTVARRMAESKATAPHFYLQAEFDLTAAVEGRNRLKAMAKEGETVPTFNDMIVKACALALREHPRANGAYRDGRIELYSRVNVGVAVAAQDALVVPTVFDADRKGLRQISAETRALAARVRDGSITPPELSGGTFTVSNLGMYGISNFQAVINTPQAGILAIGALAAKPVVTDSGAIESRQLMGVTLACDHRILYGADGAIFLARVRELLEEPLALAL